MPIFKHLLAGFMLLFTSALAAAQSFPNAPIKMIAPFPPGGPADIIARVIGEKMSQSLKQPVIIENRDGLGGALGTDETVRAKPDGYTIAIPSAGALAISPNMQKLPYDPLKDLQPITLVAKVPEMLVVATGVPANNMSELVALAKSKPGKLTFGSTGVGSLPHLAGELFKLTAKIDMTHVPYRGAVPVVTDLIGQHIDMVFLDIPALLPQVKAGQIRPIAIGTPQRVKSAPDVPTTAEVGMPDLLTENWYGLVAPAGTPANVVAILNKAATDAMKDPGVVDKLSSQGAELEAQTPDQFRAFMASELQKWGKVVHDAGIPVEK